LLVHSYKKDVSAIAKHLNWPEVKVQAAINYASAFPEEISEAMAKNETPNLEAFKRMLSQAAEFVPKNATKN
jgi:protoheme ferro-lyase